jgi:hypothetical protein
VIDDRGVAIRTSGAASLATPLQIKRPGASRFSADFIQKSNAVDPTRADIWGR